MKQDTFETHLKGYKEVFLRGIEIELDAIKGTKQQFTGRFSLLMKPAEHIAKESDKIAESVKNTPETRTIDWRETKASYEWKFEEKMFGDFNSLTHLDVPAFEFSYKFTSRPQSTSGSTEVANIRVNWVFHKKSPTDTKIERILADLHDPVDTSDSEDESPSGDLAKLDLNHA